MIYRFIVKAVAVLFLPFVKGRLRVQTDARREDNYTIY